MDEPDAKDASLTRTNSGSPTVQWLLGFGRSPVDLACSSAHSLMACPTRANCVSIVCRWISELACVFNLFIALLLLVSHGEAIQTL